MRRHWESWLPRAALLATVAGQLDSSFLWNDLGAVIAALIAARLYRHVMTSQQRYALGSVAVWLVDGPSRFLDRHGFLATIVVAVGVGLFVAALWFSGRPVPGFPIG